MYGERLIPTLAYGIHPTTSNQYSQGPVVGFSSPRLHGQKSATRLRRSAELINSRVLSQNEVSTHFWQKVYLFE